MRIDADEARIAELRRERIAELERPRLQPAAGPWVAVAESMPPKGQRVLVVDEKGWQDVAQWLPPESNFKNKGWWWNGTESIYDIVAWAPINPPRGQR